MLSEPGNHASFRAKLIFRLIGPSNAQYSGNFLPVDEVQKQLTEVKIREEAWYLLKFTSCYRICSLYLLKVLVNKANKDKKHWCRNV